MLEAGQMSEWFRFWDWFNGEGEGASETEVQNQLNDLDLGNVSTGDICNYFEDAYRGAGGEGGNFPYPPAGSSPAEAAMFYEQHITIDASQEWHFEADDGAVINLGNIGGDVVTNPEVDVDVDVEAEYGEGEHRPPKMEEKEPDGEDEDGEGEGEGQPVKTLTDLESETETSYRDTSEEQYEPAHQGGEETGGEGDGGEEAGLL
jgi:hypothetical protein